MIYLTSDTHFSHKNSMRYCGRPFFTSGRMDEEIVRRWNQTVGPDDTVYHMGDVSMHIGPIERLLPRLNGRKILIVGNHDLMYSYFLSTRGKKFVENMREKYISSGFVDVIHGSVFLSSKIRLCHFPTKNTSDSYHNNLHDHARPEDVKGVLNVCGHVHQSWLKRGNNINVGVDVWNFTPVSLDEVVRIFNSGPENIPTPNKLRISLWKAYHTLVWKARTLLRPEPKRKHDNGTIQKRNWIRKRKQKRKDQ